MYAFDTLATLFSIHRQCDMLKGFFYSLNSTTLDDSCWVCDSKERITEITRVHKRVVFRHCGGNETAIEHTVYTFCVDSIWVDCNFNVYMNIHICSDKWTEEPPKIEALWLTFRRKVLLSMKNFNEFKVRDRHKPAASLAADYRVHSTVHNLFCTSKQ